MEPFDWSVSGTVFHFESLGGGTLDLKSKVRYLIAVDVMS